MTGHKFAKHEIKAAVERIVTRVREVVLRDLRRRGVVLGMSGGIDSTVTAALCARAFGPERVLGLTMHETESDEETPRLARLVIDHLGIVHADEPITPLLAAARCYDRRDAAIRTVIPQYRSTWRCKLVVPSAVEADRLRLYSIVVRSPEGQEIRARLPVEAFLQVVAATSFKQRTRKLLEYFHADRLGYAVAGTPNRLEYELGFFVKNGDGAADVKPIAHLYKSQVYQVAEYLEVPAVIRERPPTTDTYSLPQSQEELYFALPHDQMDACLWGCDHHVPAAILAGDLGLAPDQVERVYKDIAAKRASARYLHSPPLLIG